MPKKIMVIDDEEKMCSILKQMLENEGYQVQTSTDGRAAIEEIKKDAFNLVISDVCMPLISGVELLSQIKGFKPDLPVIFVTAQDMSEVLQDALQLGLDGFIEKPFNMQTVFEVIKEKIGENAEEKKAG